jgi:hypothetical protein
MNSSSNVRKRATPSAKGDLEAAVEKADIGGGRGDVGCSLILLFSAVEKRLPGGCRAG